MDKDEILADRRMKIRGFMGWLDEEEVERQKRIEMRVEEYEKLKKNEEMRDVSCARRALTHSSLPTQIHRQTHLFDFQSTKKHRKTA